MSKPILNYDIRARDVPRSLFPTGRVKFSLGASGAEARRRRDLLNRMLREPGHWDILRSMQDGVLDAAEVCRRLWGGGTQAVEEIRRELEAKRTEEPPILDDESKRYLKWYEELKAVKSLITRRSQLKRGLSLPIDGSTLGAMRIDQVTKSQVERVVLAISDKSNTRESIRVGISALFTWSIEVEAEQASKENREPRWHINPAAQVASFKREKRVIVLTDSQILELLRHAEPYQVAYLRSMLHGGFREDELIHTRLGADLDLTSWLWKIQSRGPDEQCGCIQCRTTGWEPKTPRSARTLQMPDEPAALRESIMFNLALHPCRPGQFVFRNPRTGRAWEARALALDFKRLCEKAGVTYGRDVPGGATLHSLRHTCFTQMVRYGVPIAVIARIAGDTVETIENTYVHLVPNDLAEGIRRGPAY